jgi:hypothetical protein
VELTLKTLGTVTVSLVDSPLAEMTVTVGLDMLSRVGVAVVSIADLGVVVEFGLWAGAVGANRKLLAHKKSRRVTCTNNSTDHPKPCLYYFTSIWIIVTGPALM